MDEEIDFLHWRIDQLQAMVEDFAMRLGQEDMVFEMVRFHNEEVVPSLKKMREAQ